jgi:hypothetical protein
MTAAPPTHTDPKSTLEELRAAVAAERARGLKGAIQQAFLGLLSVLLAMLEDFRAGRLARIAPVAEPGADGAVADPSPRPTGSSPVAEPHSPARGEGEVRRGCGVESGEARAASWSADFEDEHEAYPSPSRVSPHFCEQKWEPAAGPAPRVKPGGNASLSHRGRGNELCASLRSPRFEMMARLRRRARWRNAHGMRRAFSALRRETAGAAEGAFFKNAPAGERIGATMSFQRQNDAVTLGSESISNR